MQAIAPVTTAQLLAAGQTALMKLEIYVDAAWVNLCALDAKNYVEGASVSLAGASKTPDPIMATWDALLSNENSIFHPDHPTSVYKGYNVTGRKARISIGATYGGIDYYWQRVIGVMDEPKFTAPDYKVSISGADYMKFLRDTELRSLDAGVPDNYWGTSEIFSSIASDGFVGNEIYNEVDAMDINNEDDNVDNWTPTNCTFVSQADVGGGSAFVGKATNTQMENSYVRNTNVGNATAGKEYKVTFKYRRAGGSAFPMTAGIYQGAVKIGSKGGLSSSAYESVTFYITAVETGPMIMEFRFGDTGQEFRFDQISIWEFISYWNRYYELPGASKGPHHVVLDGVPVWQGMEDEGWFHEESTRRVFFDINKTVANGTDNLVVYYFTVESPENVVADLLVKCGLYADRAAALAAMEYTATGITIDRIWFKPGSSCLQAIRKLCERCDYRFHFKYDGTPVFKPKPTPGAPVFTFTDPKQIESFSNYQNRKEIKNRIVIKGMKLAEPIGKEESMPSQLEGEAHDDASIAAYGERTLTIDNHLFQTQAAIDAIKASLLADRKDPKWFSDLEIPFNPAPLEMGDTMQWEERLSPVLDITQTGVIRDIKINNFRTIYVCER